MACKRGERVIYATSAAVVVGCLMRSLAGIADSRVLCEQDHNQANNQASRGELCVTGANNVCSREDTEAGAGEYRTEEVHMHTSRMCDPTLPTPPGCPRRCALVHRLQLVRIPIYCSCIGPPQLA